eukprot:scaffold17216_cov71-Phaeocystis_antarctica.AAC.3
MSLLLSRQELERAAGNRLVVRKVAEADQVRLDLLGDLEDDGARAQQRVGVGVAPVLALEEELSRRDGLAAWQLDGLGQRDREQQERVERLREKAPDPERVLLVIRVLGQGPSVLLLAKLNRALGQTRLDEHEALRHVC